MRNWRNWVVTLCLIIGVILIVRDTWMIPDRASIPWDIAFLGGVVGGAIVLWVGKHIPYVKMFGMAVGALGAGWIGYKSWISGRYSFIALYVVLCCIFLYNLIRLAVNLLKGRNAAGSVTQGNE